MSPKRGVAAWTARLFSWTASAAMHLIGAWLGVAIWPIFLILAWLSGFPADDRYTFRWDNPFFRGRASPEDEGLDDDTFIVVPPRRRRELPEMEKPRDTHRLWDSRNIPFDEALGPPSDFDSRFPGPTTSGFMKAKGDSLDFVSDKPFRGKGTYDVLGAEAGGGGRYGSKIVLMDAVQWGLLWLARHQGEDGSWREEAVPGRCGRALPNGRDVSGPPCGPSERTAVRDPIRCTALAALAFAGAGYTAAPPDVWDGIAYREVLGRASRFLSQPQPEAESRAFALLALSSLLRRPLRFDPSDEGAEPLRALLAIVEADPPPAEDSDADAWRALAIVSAASAGVGKSEAGLEGAMASLRRRCETLQPVDREAWPGKDLQRTYLRLLASFEPTESGKAGLPLAREFAARLREGQVHVPDACREGSWEPVAGEGRLLATIVHVLALESLPGYASRRGHPVRDR